MLRHSLLGIQIALIISTLIINTKGQEEFVMKKNGLQRIPTSMIPRNTTLINLSKNNIEETEAVDFWGLDFLTHLYLNLNSLKKFPNFTYVGDTLLELDVSDNNIQFISDEDLRPLKVIENLTIGMNGITIFPDITILGSSLEFFESKLNIFSDVEAYRFQGMSKFCTFQYRLANLTYFPNLTFVKDTLERLDLERNMISYIPYELLDMLTKLMVLRLEMNLLSQIPDARGPGNTLSYLHLRGNRFKEFPQISNLASNADKINLAENPIEVIPANNFQFLNRKDSNREFHFSLQFTNIRTIPVIVGVNLTMLTIYADDTLLICDKPLSWISTLPLLGNFTGTCSNPTDGSAALLSQARDLNVFYGTAHTKVVATGSAAIISNIYSASLPTILYRTDNRFKCLSFCLRTKGCLFVNFSRESLKCQIHNPVAGIINDVANGNHNGWNYYYIKF